MIVQPKVVLSRRLSLPVGLNCLAAQHGAVADAALRPQDRGDFGSLDSAQLSYRSTGAAQLSAKPLGRTQPERGTAVE